MELYQEYTKACQKYVDVFAKKQGLTFERWAGDVVGDTAVFSKSYFYKMSDIVHDVNTNQPTYLIILARNPIHRFSVDWLNCVQS